MAANIVKDTRTQLEKMANEALGQLTERTADMLVQQMDHTSEKVSIALKAIVASASESLSDQTGNALQAFEHSMDETAKLSVERWRQKLAGNLNALAKSLGEQFQLRGGDTE